MIRGPDDTDEDHLDCTCSGCTKKFYPRVLERGKIFKTWCHHCGRSAFVHDGMPRALMRDVYDASLWEDDEPKAKRPMDLQKIFLVAGSVFLVLCFGGYAAGWENTFKTSLLAAAFCCAAATISGRFKGLL